VADMIRTSNSESRLKLRKRFEELFLNHDGHVLDPVRSSVPPGAHSTSVAQDPQTGVSPKNVQQYPRLPPRERAD
jgi:hypothetical protein